MAEPKTIDITITNTDGQVFTAHAAFTAVPPPLPAPLIASVEPVSGPMAGGTVVTITGQHFQPGASVNFGGKDALNVQVSADGTVITCVTPSFEG